MEKEKKLRWGVLGAGDILYRWINGARQVKDMELAAVSSRTIESAQKAAQALDIPEAMTFDVLLERDDIDVVYIAVPHTAHKELALRALRAGKHVLLEKPGTVNAADFKELTECAKEQERFLMEAVWTRFFPLAQAIRTCLDSGEIGQIRSVHSAFAFRAEQGSGSGRLFDPERAGGGLLDTGVYNLHFADMVLQKDPLRITGLASFDTDELHLQVDEQASYIAQYDRGELAVMTSAVRTDMPDTAWIYGTEGHIEIPVFWKPVKMRIVTRAGMREMNFPVDQQVDGVEDEGYQYEIRHVNTCIREGLLESPVMTWEKSLSVLRLCDELRREWNFRYPFE